MSQEAKTPAPPEKPNENQRPTNCVVCNKPLKRIRRYYHDGKFYCSKGCYKKSKAKSKGTNEQTKA